MMKSLKGKTLGCLLNSSAYMIILAFLQYTDDTVAVQTSILADLIDPERFQETINQAAATAKMAQMGLDFSRHRIDPEDEAESAAFEHDHDHEHGEGDDHHHEDPFGGDEAMDVMDEAEPVIDMTTVDHPLVQVMLNYQGAKMFLNLFSVRDTR